MSKPRAVKKEIPVQEIRKPALIRIPIHRKPFSESPTRRPSMVEVRRQRVLARDSKRALVSAALKKAVQHAAELAALRERRHQREVSFEEFAHTLQRLESLTELLPLVLDEEKTAGSPFQNLFWPAPRPAKF